MQGMRGRYRNPRRSSSQGKEEKVKAKFGIARRSPGRVWYCWRCCAWPDGVPLHASATTRSRQSAGCGNWRTNVSSEPRSDSTERWRSNPANNALEFTKPSRESRQSGFAAKSCEYNSCNKSCCSSVQCEICHDGSGLWVSAVQKSEWV